MNSFNKRNLNMSWLQEQEESIVQEPQFVFKACINNIEEK